MIFDTHAHYDDEQFDIDRDALLRGMAEQNVGTIINVGASLEGCWRSVELAHQYPFVYAAVGIHPDEVGDLNEESFARLRETARMEEKVVAIGEIGLDYHWDVQPHEVQKYWFVKQMELAKELDLPIAVHSRDAAKDTFDLIADRGQSMDKDTKGCRQMHIQFLRQQRSDHTAEHISGSCCCHTVIATDINITLSIRLCCNRSCIF